MINYNVLNNMQFYKNDKVSFKYENSIMKTIISVVCLIV